jgi:hypothetical protein
VDEETNVLARQQEVCEKDATELTDSSGAVKKRKGAKLNDESAKQEGSLCAISILS